MTTVPIARLIDHSLLHPALTEAETRAGCQYARRADVASVCVKPYAVRLAAECLAGSRVAVGTVVGFPHGGHDTRVKVFEAELACSEGATELDMVINIGRALGEQWDEVEADVRAVVEAAHAHGALIKVIFETDLVRDDASKIRLCEIAVRAGAEFVKTSTGFGFVKQGDGRYDYQGATPHDVALLRAHCPPHVQVKAAGGIRTYEQAARLREMGATRLGATATETIIQGEALAR